MSNKQQKCNSFEYIFLIKKSMLLKFYFLFLIKIMNEDNWFYKVKEVFLI